MIAIPSLATLCLLSTSWLSPAIAQTKKSAADYYVDHLPGAPLPLLKMHAGHIEVTPEHHGNLFFWHYANKHIGDRQRTVLWLNGGPGCSSLDGALMEVGPYRLRDDKLVLNDGSWDEFANLLFVDNPVGTGFSYVDTDSYLHDLPDVGTQMVTFLERFFELFPQYLTDQLYLAGESYAGQYIPYIAQAIMERNVKAQQKWNLTGLLIGNGWIDPVRQYLAYLPYAYKEDLLQAGTPAADKVVAQQEACIAALDNGGKDQVSTRPCEAILSEILRVTHEDPKLKDQCLNMYDIRKTDTYESCGMNWPPDLKALTPYLRRKDVLDALHINADKATGWAECNDQVGGAFNARHSTPSVHLLPDIVKEVPVLLFSGDRDLICNHIGTEDLINNMAFNNGQGFETSPGVTAPKLNWTFEGEPAGIYQQARNLTYVLFYNSSHMVPFDYPRRTRDMLDRFMGVDISSVGGKPTDSRIDGEKGPNTSGGGANGTTPEKEKQKLDEARWAAYYRSGEVALVFVIIAAGAWGWFVVRQRRKMSGYKGVFGGGDDDGPAAGRGLGLGLGKGRKDVEAADFDEAELDDLTGDGRGRFRDDERERFDVGDDSGSDDDVGKGKARANGHR